MVFTTIEVGYDVEKERHDEVIKKIKELYPDLEIIKEGNEIKVRGYLSNYKKR